MKKKPTRKASPARTSRSATRTKVSRKTVKKTAKPAARRGRSKPEQELRPAAAPAAHVESPAAPAAAATPVLRLETSCTLREASDLHFSMLGIRQDAGPFRIDGSAVERVDTAGLQLLVCFARARAAAGGTIEWTAVSPELARCVSRLGLGDILGLPSIAAGDAS